MLSDDTRIRQICERSLCQLMVNAVAGDISLCDNSIENGLQLIDNFGGAVENCSDETFFSVVISTVWEMTVVSGQLTIVKQGHLRRMLRRRAFFIVAVPFVEHGKNKMHIHQAEFV